MAFRRALTTTTALFVFSFKRKAAEPEGGFYKSFKTVRIETTRVPVYTATGVLETATGVAVFLGRCGDRPARDSFTSAAK